MSQQDPPSQPPPPGSKPPGPTGPTPTGPTPAHTPPGGRHPHHDETRTAWAAGGTAFAGTLLLIAGILAILEGIAGISRDVVYVVTHGSYTYKFNARAWGWIHLVIGVIAFLVGYGVLRGAEWARWTGILIAGLSMIANFIFLPYQPVWAVILIAIDIFVIWSLATYGRTGHRRTAAGGAL
ncbi:hypothetical protein OG552_15015 [Streptomyces sp. NBC_01476]|uniref:DUF7144 family membrane protein n=1 Tax=Streptomyces sp. NBC_01476 TaxID=2903881 RepID=UPI002E2F152B|nr:hypothetical protein [Streptomyces sp. NBC_01476]